MQKTLHQTKSAISVGGIGNGVCGNGNLWFPDDIGLIAGINKVFQTLTNKLVSASKVYAMEISKEKSKTIVNSIDIDEYPCKHINGWHYSRRC